MNHEDLMAVKTAWYYYIENMTQQEISKKLCISRIRVIKLLDKARKEGLIQFKIRQDGEQHMQIEQQITKKWGLKDTFVVPSVSSDNNLNETIAKGAAMYINNRLADNCFINMGYGDTPSRILNHLATMTESPINVVSLTGGVSYYLPNAKSNIFNAKLYLIPAPLIVSSKELVTAIREEACVSEIFRMVRLASITLVGIGGMKSDATILKNGIFNKNDLLYLTLKGAVGDILCHFIDQDGNLVESDTENRLISTSLSTLRELDNVVGVAGGPSKIDAIRAALNGKYLDILITDESTAQQLLEVEKDNVSGNSETKD